MKEIFYSRASERKFSILELAAPPQLSVAARRKSSISGANLNMVLQTYGLSISSDDECVENRLTDNDEIISDRKSVNYSDNMLAMSPFAGDYPPTTNYINYTDLDASYSTQGNNFTASSLLHHQDDPNFRSEAHHKSQMMMLLNGIRSARSSFIVSPSALFISMVHSAM